MNVPYISINETEQCYIDRVIEINIKGMIWGSQIATDTFLAQKSGQIWNMEGLGSDGMIINNTVFYGMSKRALTYFTKGLAKELSGTPVFAGRLSPGMMLTDFITKTPDGDASRVINDSSFKKIFNILADKPETVAVFLVDKILSNTKNNAHIVWLSKRKTMIRFISSSFKKRDLI